MSEVDRGSRITAGEGFVRGLKPLVNLEDVLGRRRVVREDRGVNAGIESRRMEELGRGASRRLDAARLQVDEAHGNAAIALAPDRRAQADLARPEFHRDERLRLGSTVSELRQNELWSRNSR